MRWARWRISTSPTSKPADTVRGGGQLPSEAQPDRRSPRPRSCRATSMPASRRRAGAIATASSTAARRRRSIAAGSGTCRCRSMPTAMADAAAAADRPSRLQQLPLDRLPGRLVAQDARPARRHARRRARSASTSARGRSCTTRCASWSAPCSSSAAANGRRRDVADGARRARSHARRADGAAAGALPDGGALRPRCRPATPM